MDLKIGTCSWNYDSWTGLVYSGKKQRAHEYLSEYSRKYRTVEIDSWFYRLPPPDEAETYDRSVGPGFRFTCKVPRALTLTHERKKAKDGGLAKNDFFLSPELFDSFIAAVEPLLPRIDALMFEFEYLNKQKMPSAEEFIRLFEAFLRQAPAGLPYAVEIRNGNYLKPQYYLFLERNRLIHVFSEKIYMPHIYDVYPGVRPCLGGRTVVRLLGGDRKEMEKRSHGRWDALIEPRDDLEKISEMLRQLLREGDVTVNVNNHYEGSAPLTIERILRLLE